VGWYFFPAFSLRNFETDKEIVSVRLRVALVLILGMECVPLILEEKSILIYICFYENKTRAGIFKPLWSPGIDAKASTPPAYVAWRAGTITLFLVGA
jgi:hypothetical protein